jgi:phosphatidylethanolamine-binding protein (PEBP) family uncharacterized protein
MTIEFTSRAFSHNDSIPAIHTCDGGDISPFLSWSGLPPGSRSLALIVDDLNLPDKVKLLQAMLGDILGKAELIGTYQR